LAAFARLAAVAEAEPEPASDQARKPALTLSRPGIALSATARKTVAFAAMVAGETVAFTPVSMSVTFTGFAAAFAGFTPTFAGFTAAATMTRASLAAAPVADTAAMAAAFSTAAPSAITAAMPASFAAPAIFGEGGRRDRNRNACDGERQDTNCERSGRRKQCATSLPDRLHGMSFLNREAATVTIESRRSRLGIHHRPGSLSLGVIFLLYRCGNNPHAAAPA
jgi:hypothetical protein